jgi:fatty-acyl-CoA synthase
MTSVPALPGRGMTMSDQLRRWARLSPDVAALRFEKRTLTYRDLDARVDRLAGALAARGLGAGDRLAVLSPNSVEVWETYLAGVRLGAAVVPVNFRLAVPEVAHILADSAPRVLVVDGSLAAVAAPALAAAGLPDVLVLVTGDAADQGYEAVLASGPDGPLERGIPEDSAAFIIYTSGTTGRPKGAVLTHRNLLLHVFSQLATINDDSTRRIEAPGTPMFHIAGIAGGLPSLLHGGTHVILRSGGLGPAQILDLIETERLTTIGLVPSVWAQVIAEPDIAERDLSSLRVAYWGAAPASTRLLRSMIDTLAPAQVVSYFGQTECCPVTCVLRGEDAVRKLGSIGRPMLNVEIRLVDDDLQDVPVGEVGEIVYRSPMVMKEYWNDPAATAQAFDGGWFHSGDLVREDEEGFLFVVDRKKDMIISGGENIYCVEVEDVVGSHPAVAEVAVIGVPDEKYGETPLAVVRAADPAHPPAADELNAWCRERLASYKRPRHYVVVPDPLPRNAGGKVVKGELRDRFRAPALPAV